LLIKYLLSKLSEKLKRFTPQGIPNDNYIV